MWLSAFILDCAGPPLVYSRRMSTVATVASMPAPVRAGTAAEIAARRISGCVTIAKSCYGIA